MLFPVADNNQPAGDYVYMAETLFTQLHKLQQPTAVGPAFLLGKLTLSLSAQEAAMPIESCQVQMELESLRSANRLFIPWPKDGSHIVADSMRSDGQSLEWQWSEDGAGFWIQIASIGKHEITFTLQPTARGGEKNLSWRWPLPPHTTCRLNLSHELAVRLDPITNWSTATEREPSGNLNIDLSEQAEVKLAVKKISPTAEPTRVEQLQWARVWPGEV